MAILEKIDKFLFYAMIGFLFVGLAGFVDNLDNKERILEKFQQEPGNATVGLFQFAYAYSSITPSLMSDWLPTFLHPKEKYMFLLEDIPLMDGTDLIFLIPIILLSAWILNKIKYFQKGIGIFYMVLILLAITLISWIILKVIMYQVMLDGAEKLGITPEEVIQARIHSNETAGSFWPVVVVTILLFAISLFKVISGSIKNRQQKR